MSPSTWPSFSGGDGERERLIGGRLRADDVRDERVARRPDRRGERVALQVGDGRRVVIGVPFWATSAWFTSQ